MEIGIGLPGHVGRIDRRALIEWAVRAERRGFSTLSVSDRLVWSTPEPLTTLAAVAGATSRIKLLTSILLAPLHTNHALFAKQAATVDQLAGAHRLALGLAPGLREDDFRAGDVEFSTRGAQLDALLERSTAIWKSPGGVGPAPATPGGPALLFGGTSNAALRRITTWGTGWIAGDATVGDIDGFAPRLRAPWTKAGRVGKPRVIASVMFALGPGARESVATALRSYYAFGGEEYVQYGIDIAYTDRDRIASAVTDFEKAGCDELIFMGNDGDPDQVDLLADALGL